MRLHRRRLVVDLCQAGAVVPEGEPASVLLPGGDEVDEKARTALGVEPGCGAPGGVGVGGEVAGADAGLRADERLHAAHGEVDLPPHLVAAHQRLQPH